jgi:hypothetical protein
MPLEKPLPSKPTVCRNPDDGQLEIDCPISCWMRCGLSGTTLVVFSIIAWCNLPTAVHEACYRFGDRQFTPQLNYRLRLGEWYARYAAHIAGLDNRWQMYGGQSRFNWEFQFYGEYGEEGEMLERLLPLPRQSQRDLYRRWIVDFKEAKFYLNIYNNEVGRESYARFLARSYPEYQGKLLKNIRVDMKIRYILPPYVAVAEQKLFEDGDSVITRDRFAVAQEARWALDQQRRPSPFALRLTPASQSASDSTIQPTE